MITALCLKNEHSDNSTAARYSQLEEFKIVTQRLDSFHEELRDHREILKKINDSLVTVAAQHERLNNHQAALLEIRGDIKYIETRQEEIVKWQASCPRKQISSMWGAIITIVIAGLIAFFSHFLGGRGSGGLQ